MANEQAKGEMDNVAIQLRGKSDKRIAQREVANQIAILLAEDFTPSTATVEHIGADAVWLDFPNGQVFEVKVTAKRRRTIAGESR